MHMLGLDMTLARYDFSQLQLQLAVPGYSCSRLQLFPATAQAAPGYSLSAYSQAQRERMPGMELVIVGNCLLH